MQAHLDYKCLNAPYNIKSQFEQQNTTSITGNFNDHIREKEQQSLEILLTEALSLAETSFKLPNREKMEEIKMQMNSNTPSLLKQIRIEITTEFYKEAEKETKKDDIIAFELYKEAAKKGHNDSIHNLGECYYYRRET
ncbi:hypothetical protein C1646_776867 [Rhizophagus diaphanus]|nr:hypothetical protein C1646_776867 [Rhizophagus diaphanus] [Rhizophagus sp. MUCL 43196]